MPENLIPDRGIYLFFRKVNGQHNPNHRLQLAGQHACPINSLGVQSCCCATRGKGEKSVVLLWVPKLGLLGLEKEVRIQPKGWTYLHHPSPGWPTHRPAHCLRPAVYRAVWGPPRPSVPVHSLNRMADLAKKGYFCLSAEENRPQNCHFGQKSFWRQNQCLLRHSLHRPQKSLWMWPEQSSSCLHEASCWTSCSVASGGFMLSLIWVSPGDPRWVKSMDN